MAGASRRDFLAGTASFALAAAAGGLVRAQGAMGPNDKFDLVIKGGDVLDPSQKLRGEARHRHPLRRDRGARGRHPGRARRCACSMPRGKLVTPGPRRPARARLPLRLGDRHPGRRAGAASSAPRRCVSAGDAGANNFAAFRRHIVGADAHAPLRLRAHRQHRPAPASRSPSSTTSTSRRSDAAAKARRRERRHGASASRCACRENVIAKHGLEPLKRAITACEMAGTGAQGHVPHRRRRDARADVADPRHCCGRATSSRTAYSGAPNIAGEFTNIVQDGKLLPAALAAKQRGVVFDVGHGGGSFDYTVAEAAIAAGLRRPTRSPPTSTSSPATRPACPT